MTRLLCALLVLAWASPALAAKTLYVDIATGNDATTYSANDVNNKWATLCRALKGVTNCQGTAVPLQAADDGDTIVVTPGVYSGAGSNSRLTPAHFPTNDGSVGLPITIQATGGVVEIRLSSGAGPAFGCRNNSYVTWTADATGSWLVNEDHIPVVPDTGPVVLSSSDHCIVERAVVDGFSVDYPGTGGDNHVGIRIEFCDDCEVSNNTIDGIGSIEGVAPGVQAYRQNDAGIMMYSSNRVLIEHNEISTVGTGIYIKDLAADTGTQDANIVRFNWIHDSNVHGIFIGKDEDGRIYQNLIEDSGECVHFRDLADSAGTEDDDYPLRTIVANNTCYTVVSGIGLSGAYGLTTDVQFAGNIVLAVTTMIAGFDSDYDLPGDIDFEHNVYRGTYSPFAQLDATTRTFATWKSTYTKDSAAVLSITTDPLFLGGTPCRGYELHAASPARALSVDVADIDNDANTSETVHAGACQTGSEVFGVEGTESEPDPDPEPDPTPATNAGRWRRRLTVGG
jgi:hypothetical protein